MEYIIYFISVIVAIISFMMVFVIIRGKKSFVHFIIPVYMNCVIIIALYTKELGVFGLLGVLGSIPIIMKLKAKWRGSNT